MFAATRRRKSSRLTCVRQLLGSRKVKASQAGEMLQASDAASAECLPPHDATMMVGFEAGLINWAGQLALRID